LSDVVAGDKLLKDLAAIFTRYVILPKHAAEALWACRPSAASSSAAAFISAMSSKRATVTW
jgi:hypothetical protein